MEKEEVIKVKDMVLRGKGYGGMNRVEFIRFIF